MSVTHYLATSYYDFLSAVLALKLFVLLFILLFVIVRRPVLKKVACLDPPPLLLGKTYLWSNLKLVGLPAVECPRKVIDVPKYPPAESIAFLISIYAFDIIMLYPYTKEGSTRKLPSVFFLATIVGSILQTTSAVGWSCVEANWRSVERRYALWHNRPWSCYSWSFILTGMAIGVPLVYQSVWMVGNFVVINILPVLLAAGLNAVAPFKFW
jgi:hypothetical protein